MVLTKERLLGVYVQALRSARDPAELPHDGLVAELGIDSITALEILIFVEEEFGVTIEDEDLSPALIDSVDTLARYVEAHRLAGVEGE
jgi:acyl carrier protein